MIRNKLKLAAVLTGLLFLMPFPLPAVLIDGFNLGEDFVESVTDKGPSTQTGISNVIGDSRTIQIIPPNDDEMGATSLSVDLDNSNELAHSQSASYNGASKVTWNNDGNGLGGVNLMDGDNAISVRITKIDVGQVDLTFMVTDQGLNSASLLRSSLTAGWSDFLFDDFIGTVDFTDVDSIMLTIAAEIDSDLTIDTIQTRNISNGGGNGGGNGGFATPEPSAFVLAALALTVGLGFTRFSHRRHRRSADTG